MITVSLTLETTAYTLDQLISRPEPQLALAGRSNVGKSSLINALAGRKKLAKVSSTPGKTRSVNFYKVEPYDFSLVDLPGYGYARASHTERQKWARLLEHYLTDCKKLRALVLLLDCRLPPQKIDLELASFARQCRLPLLPVLTKADKCKQQECALRQKQWQNLLGVRPVVTSAERRLGMEQLWRALAIAAEAAPEARKSAPASEKKPEEK